MPRSKSFAKPGPSARARPCDHRTLAVVFTELGCHARCRTCRTVGPEQPSSETALQAYWSWERAGGKYYG